MFRKFLEGLTFGGGFAISFVVVMALGLLVLPVTFTSAPSNVSGPVTSSVAPPPEVLKHLDQAPQFHELPLEEQIMKASVIALARYEAAPDGKQKAIIKEFLKKEPNTTIYYNTGDEYPNGSFYPNVKTGYGDGLIVFFVGSPASMRMSMTYSGDRIHSLGDIPLQLFREKCKANA